MIAESITSRETDMQARSEALLQTLKSGGWIDFESKGNDFAPLLPIMAEALDMHRELHELCAALPWREDSRGKANALDMVGLLNALCELGFVAHALRLNLDNLDPRLCPCLFVSGEGSEESVIAVLSFDEESGDFDVFNARTKVFEKISAKDTIQGTAWIFVPEEKLENSLSENVREASGNGWFHALMERFSGGLWQIVAIGAMLTFLSLAAPLFVMLVYDRVIGAHAPEALLPLLIGALLALCTEGALRLVRAHVLSWYGARLDYIVGSQIFERLMHLPVLFTERASVAAQIARIKAFDAVRAFFTGTSFIAMAELPFTLILIGAIVIIAGPIALVPVIAAAFYLLLIYIMRPHVRTAMRLAAKSHAAKQEMIIETFEKMDGLRVGGLTSIWFRDFRDLSGKASLSGFRSSFLSSLLEVFSQGIYTLAGLSVVVWGVIHIWEGGMSAGALIAVMILTWRVLGPMQILANALPRFEQLKNAVGQINRLMDIEGESTDAKVTARLDQPKGTLDFQKVGLRYTKDNDPVFAGLTFKVKPGEMMALTGGNGSGKSTILKLINGLYHPQAGALHIDGIDIRQLDPQHLRRHVTYVPQNPVVFQGTIADNLRFANPLASDELLQNALERVDLQSYVKNLPLGMHTVIGMHGAAQLPTGLAYNLNLARAYVKDTSVMLIDEMPYAFLNSVSGERFKNILKSWKGKKTVVFVTHREDYITLADKAVLLRAGRSAQVGKPEDIIRSIYDSQEAVYA